MSEEFIQRKVMEDRPKIGKWDFYNIGNTTLQELKAYKIIRNIDYRPYERKKVDGLIVLNKQVIAVVEFKKPSEFKTKSKQSKAVIQEMAVANLLDAKIYIATDGDNTIWVNPQTGNEIKNEDGSILKYKFDYKDEKLASVIRKVIDSINENNDTIRPVKLINPTDLAQSIWQDVWSVSGATPENCLYTFVELFIFKYLSDLNILTGMWSFDYLYSLYETGNEDEEVLGYYADNIRPYIKKIFVAGEDGTTIINGSVFVNKDEQSDIRYKSVFHKVLTKFKNYGKLQNIDYDFKSRLFESFLKQSISKKNWGQYFTPLTVVRSIVDMAEREIKPGITICDPACGVGKFLLEPILKKLNQYYDITTKGEIIPKINIIGFDKGFDKDEQKTIILAKANMVIYFSNLLKDSPNIISSMPQLLNSSFVLKKDSILGTLADPVKDRYELILTNPPYVTSGSSNLKEEIKKDAKLDEYYKKNGMGVEGLFMEWIVRALKPGGSAYIIVPDGIMNRQNDVELRRFIKESCYINCVISLPEKTFFTTQKKTYILSITKKESTSINQTRPVFTYLVSEIGESRDVYRFEIEQNDLYDAVKMYKSFMGSPDYIIENNNNPRCKIQPIEKFCPDAHWSVDRWWTNEEKVLLGIEEDKETLTIQELGEYVSEIANSLNEISNSMSDFQSHSGGEFRYQMQRLDNKSLFELSIGKRVVKKDFHKMEGKFPIYSANVHEPIGYHNTSNITNFDNNFVLWGIDGEFEFNFLKKGSKFRYTDHCGAIRILNDDIMPEYLMIQLERAKKIYGFDRGLRSSLKNMAIIEIPIPYDDNGRISKEAQLHSIEKYKLYVDLKSRLKECQEKMNGVTLSVE